MLTREQIIQNIEALEKQGASQVEVQGYIDSTSNKKPVAALPPKKEVGMLRSIGGSITKPFEKLSATALKFGGGAVAYGLDAVTPSKKTFSSFKDATEKVGTGFDKGAFSATKAFTGEQIQPVSSVKDLAGTALEAASIAVPVVRAPAFLGKIAKGAVGKAAVEGALTAGASGFVGGTGRGLQEGRDIGNSLEQGLVEGAIAAPLGLALGGIGGAIVRAPKLATKAGRSEASTQAAKEGFSRDLDALFSSTKSLQASVSDLQKAQVPVKEILSDFNIAKNIKVQNKTVVVDDAIIEIQKNIDRASASKRELLPEIDKFVPPTQREEIRALALANIDKQLLDLDQQDLIRRINNQIDAFPDSLSLVDVDKTRAKAFNSARDAKGQQKSDSEYAAIENALRKILFDKTDNLPFDTTGEIKGLNVYIRNNLKTMEFLDKKIRGQKVVGGRLGEYFARGIGAVAGSQGGVLGAIAGSEIAGYVSNVIVNNNLGSSVKMRLIMTAAKETGDPQVIQAATDLVNKLRLRVLPALPAPSSQFKSQIPSGKTIPLGASTIDELQAPTGDQSLIPSMSRQNTANTTTTINPNIAINQSINMPARSSASFNASTANTTSNKNNIVKNVAISKTLPQSAKQATELSTDSVSDAKTAIAKGMTEDEFVKSQRGTEITDSAFTRNKISSVYHQTSPQSARSTIFASTENRGLNVSTLPELALGQGGKGATIEFSTRRLNGGKIQKPGADFIKSSQGKYPEYELSHAPSKLTPDVRSVTFDQQLSVKGERDFFGLRQDWKDTKKLLPDGKVKYLNPTHKTTNELREEYRAAKIPSGKTIPAKPKGFIQTTIDMLKDPKTRQGGFVRIPGSKKSLPEGKGVSSINSTTDSVSDAKTAIAKGMTEDEFVKGQGKPLYHGTGAKFDSFSKDMRGSITGAKSAEGAIWFTDDIATAKAYSIYASETGIVTKTLKEADALELIAKKSGKESDWTRYDKKLAEAEVLDTYDANFERRKGANVKEAHISGDLYEVDAKGKTPQELSIDGDIDTWLNIQIKTAKAKGKTGVKISNLDDAVGLSDKPSTHYAIFDSNQIKTTSQLRAEYQAAKGNNSLSKEIIDSSVSSKLPPKKVVRTNSEVTPELKENISEIINAFRKQTKVSADKMIELEADMGSIIEDFGFAIPKTRAEQIKILDVIYNRK